MARPAPIREHLPFSAADQGATRPILILGSGMVGGAIAAACRHRALAHVLVDADEAIATGGAALIDRHDPWATIDATAEHDGRSRFAYGELIRPCADAMVALTIVEGAGDAADARQDDVEGALLVRAGTLFTPFDPGNLVAAAVAAMAEGRWPDDGEAMLSPTYLPDFCDALLDLVIDGANGNWLLTNGERLSRAAFFNRLAEACGLPAPFGADRRQTSPVAPGHLPLLPALDNAIGRFAREMQARGALAGRAVA